MAESFKKLRKQVRSDKARRARVEQHKRAMLYVLKLAELRESQDKTQADVAGTLHVTQANVSRLEHQDDLYLSTLSNYISALGGHLELSAVFPDRTVQLEPRSK